MHALHSIVEFIMNISGKDVDLLSRQTLVGQFNIGQDKNLSVEFSLFSI
jgi:hypothetical protein